MSILHQNGTEKHTSFSPGNLKRSCHHLGDQDREAIKRICERLDLPTGALAIRYAVRLLDRKLSETLRMTETAILLGGVEVERKG